MSKTKIRVGKAVWVTSETVPNLEGLESTCEKRTLVWVMQTSGEYAMVRKGAGSMPFVCRVVELVQENMLEVRWDGYVYNARSRPLSHGYWWWLPQCLLDEDKTDKQYWSVSLEGPNTDKVGVFVGPLNPPVPVG